MQKELEEIFEYRGVEDFVAAEDPDRFFAAWEDNPDVFLLVPKDVEPKPPLFSFPMLTDIIVLSHFFFLNI